MIFRNHSNILICWLVIIGINGINHAFAALCKTFSEDWSNDAENPALIIGKSFKIYFNNISDFIYES